MRTPKYFLFLLAFALAFLMAAGADDPGAGLTCKIVVPSNVPDRYGEFAAKLVLTNVSKEVVRVCVIPMGRRCDSGKEAYCASFDPEGWKSDAPTFEQIAQMVKTLQPGESVDLPFEVGGEGPAIDVTAIYHVSEQFAKRLNVWHGLIKAEKITLHPAKSG